MVPLTESDRNLIRALFTPGTYPKHTLLVNEGQTARQLYFTQSGFVRVFSQTDGVDITSHLNCPPGFVTSFTSFINQTPSPDYVECVTDAELLGITRPNLDRLYTQSPNLAEFGRLIYEQSLAYNEQRTKDLVTLTAEQRYLKLLKTYPAIVQNVPLQYIASFIGIKPESLSRIRRQIIS